MSRPAERLRECLAADERLTAVHSVRLSEGSAWTDVALGVTDRRMLWLGDDGRFASLAIESISAVRSRPRTTPIYRGIDAPWLFGSGAVAAVLGLLGVAVLAASALEPLLLLATVGGLAGAASLYRVDDATDWPPAAAVATVVRQYDLDGRFGVDEGSRADVDAPRRLLVGGSALLALAGFLALVVLAGNPLVPLFALGTVGGLAVADHARRRGADADRVELDWRREQEVSISTDAGRRVHIRTDPSSTLARELGRLAFVERDGRASVAPPRS